MSHDSPSRRQFLQQSAFFVSLVVPSAGLADRHVWAQDIAPVEDMLQMTFPNLRLLGRALSAEAKCKSVNNKCASEIVPGLQQAIHNSFEEGRVFTLDGWVISKEEIDLCVTLYESTV